MANMKLAKGKQHSIGVSLVRLFYSKTLWVSGSNFLSLGLGFLASIIIARTLGVTGRGALSTVLVWSLVIRSVMELGIPQALTFLPARQPQKTAGLFGVALVLALAQGAVVMLAAGALGWLLLYPSQPEEFFYMLYYSTTAPAVLGITYITSLLLGISNIVWFNVLRVLQALVLPGATALVFLKGQDLGMLIDCLIWLQVIVFLVALAVAVLKFNLSLAGFGANFKETLRQGSKSYWGNLSWLLNGKLDQFLMSFMLSQEQLGIYAVAVSYANLNFPLAAAIANLTFSKAARSKKPSKSSKLVYGSLLKGSLAVTLISLALAAIAPFLIPAVFGKGFQDAVWIALLLIGGGILLGLNYILSDGLRGLGLPEIPSKAEFYSLLFTVAGLLLVLKPFQLPGAALVSLVAYALVFIYLLQFLVRLNRRQTDQELENPELAKFLEFAEYTRPQGVLEKLLQNWVATPRPTRKGRGRLKPGFLQSIVISVILLTTLFTLALIMFGPGENKNSAVACQKVQTYASTIDTPRFMGFGGSADCNGR